jgi:hypothetical protein
MHGRDEDEVKQAVLGEVATDTISVPLAADDFELIDRALSALAFDYAEVPHDAIAELRDRLKRARLLP